MIRLIGFLLMLTAADACTDQLAIATGTTVAASSMGGVVGTGGGYDALESKGRRKKGPSTIVREDRLLHHGRRTKLTAASQDLVRNFAIAGWMIRRHLDYVALFDFHGRNRNSERLLQRFTPEQLEKLDNDLEREMMIDSKAGKCDAGGRFTREKMFRMAELRRTIDGDTGLALLRNGRMQGIESDLIRNLTDKDLRDKRFRGNGDISEWESGVRLGPAGRALDFALHRRGRGGSGYELERIVPARNLIHYGHFLRYASDQVRGVSPIVAALNNLRDVYSGIDYALAKMKVSQLFALSIFSDAKNGAGEYTEIDEGDDEDGPEGKRYEVNFGLGPVHLELDGKDRAEFLESKTPSTEMQQFCSLVIGVALKSLDIPYSFYDESHTNFFGSRAAWMHYDRAALDKRDDQIQMREDYGLWKMRQFVQAGRLQLPPGMIVTDVETEWVPRGMPWWDPTKEIRGDKEAVGAGFDNPERICKQRGKGSVYDNMRTTARVIAECRKISKEILGDEDAMKLDYAIYPEINVAVPQEGDA